MPETTTGATSTVSTTSTTPATSTDTSNDDFSLFSGAWQEEGTYQSDFEDGGFSSQYKEVIKHADVKNGGSTSDIPSDSSQVAWLASSGFSATASYGVEQSANLMQGGQTFNVQNLDDDLVSAPAATTPAGTSEGTSEGAQQGIIKDPYLLFKFGYYGSTRYRNIKSAIAAAIEN